MNIDYEMELGEVYVIASQDTFTDVVKRVLWSVSFFDTDNPDIKSKGLIETYLDVDAISADTYTPYEAVTQTQILQWALDKQGGSRFLDSLLEGGHADDLAKRIDNATFVEKDIDLLAES
jgi:hypothetical protein